MPFFLYSYEPLSHQSTEILKNLGYDSNHQITILLKKTQQHFSDNFLIFLGENFSDELHKQDTVYNLFLTFLNHYDNLDKMKILASQSNNITDFITALTKPVPTRSKILLINKDNFEEWKAKAASGDVNAQYEMGKIYWHLNDIVSQDILESLRYFKMAADEQHPEAPKRFKKVLGCLKSLIFTDPKNPNALKYQNYLKKLKTTTCNA